MQKTRKISICIITALMVFSFGFNYAQASAPSITTNSADITSSHNVTLNCSYNSNGLYTTIWFQLSTNSSLSGARNVYANPDCTAGLINLISGTTYYFRAAAKNSDGTSTGSVNSFTMPGSTGGSASSTGSGSSSSSGSNSGSTYNGNYSSGGYNNGSTSGPTAPQATTNGPVSVSSTSAVVNGSINPDNADTKFWFELGTTQALDKKTTIESAGSGNSWQVVTANFSGLNPNTKYFYRVVAQNNFGTAIGDIKIFTTSSVSGGTSSGGQVLGAVSGSGSNSGGTKTTTSGSSTSGSTSTTDKNQPNSRPSFISLEYSLNDGGALVVASEDVKPNPGDEFSYTVIYKNDTLYPFNEAVLKVIIPVDADYLSANRESLKISANTIEFNLGNIQPGSQGSITVISKVKETAKPGSSLIFTSVLGYKDRFGVQLATTSYLTVHVGQDEATASLSAFSIGSFFGSTGVFILIVFALIILIALLAYGLMRIRNSKNKNNKKVEDSIMNLDIPSTFEPIGPATGGIEFKR